MLLKRIGVNWTVKHCNSNYLSKYGNSSDSRINPKHLNGNKGIHGKLEAHGQTIVQQGKQFLLGDL